MSWFLLPKEYQDIVYRCIACQRAETWTKEQQKQEFEVEGQYICARRVLCRDCFLRKQELSNSLHARQQAGAGKELPQSELLAWQAELEEYRRLGGRSNSAISNMLSKKLGRVVPPKPASPGDDATSNQPL